MSNSFLSVPVDERSAADLAAAGLRLELVDPTADGPIAAWQAADSRGFHGTAPSEAELAEGKAASAARRNIAVYDGGLASPVGTLASWAAPLTLPGGRRLDSWAIAAVTVAPTHRRRGIATALLGGELRTAASLGVPLAILTVSESVIYGRWGFGPATFRTEWSVDTKRVQWAGGPTPGTLAFADPADYRATAAEVLDRAMASRAGEIGLLPSLADAVVRPSAGDSDAAGWRLVRYDGPDGEPEGFVSYVTKEGDDFTRHIVEVRYLAASTDRAAAALWRYLLEIDLVGEVRIGVRGVDEPVTSLVSDVRGARVTGVADHLWVRVLDVPAALAARRYERDGELVVAVTDDLGFADGVWRISVVDGAATVEPSTDAADVTLPVTALGSIYLGHDAVRGLALAGRIVGASDAVQRLDALFRTAVPPRLSTWF